jgi:hypothetical protein
VTEPVVADGATVCGVETLDVFDVEVFAAVEAALTFVVVVVFEVEVLAVAGRDAGAGVTAAAAGAAGSRVRVVTDGGLTTVTLVVGFDGTPGSSATAWLFVPSHSATGALFTVTTGASLLSAECAIPAGSAAHATMMANAATRRTTRLVLITLNPPGSKEPQWAHATNVKGTREYLPAS